MMCKVLTQEASQQVVLMTLLVSQLPMVMPVVPAALRARRPGPGLRRLRPGGSGPAGPAQLFGGDHGEEVLLGR